MRRRFERASAVAPWLVAALFLGTSGSAGRAAGLPADPLAEGFRDPPRSYSQVPFWSWNGRLEPDRIRWQIDQMVEKGVYGAFLHARAGLNLDATPYFSDGWWRAVEAAVEHGAEVGFATWLYDEDQWPSGAAGGRTIRANPERNTRKGLRTLERRVAGPAEVPLRFEGALYVVAGRLGADGALEAATLADVTAHNDPAPSPVDPEPTRGLRVGVVSDWDPPRLAGRCRALGCSVTELRTQQAATLQADALDVLVSDVGTPGTALPRERLLAWIRAGGGYVDFSHSELGDSLYDLTPRIEPDSPSHRWLLPEHPIASVPNPDPDAGYSGRRWSDMLWSGGADWDGFERVLADPRFDPPPASILARKEGKGRTVLLGATQAAREEEPHLELLQNVLVWASGREAGARRASAKRPEAKAPWSCPEGTWLLVAYLPDTRPGTEAMPAVNYMNRATVRDFIDITYEEYARRVGRHFGTTIPGVFFDEIHNSGVEIVWVEGFAEAFRKRKGYDLIPFLPGLSRDVGPSTPKLRCDYYDVYAQLYEDAWFVQISEWCAAHGLEWTGHTVEDLEAYRTQGSYFRTIRHLQIPGTDNEDFRYRYPRRIDPWKPKQLASIAHLYGRPRAAAEAMGGAGWSFTLESARYGFNLLAAYGINFFIPHLFHYAQDRPENVDDWPNSWFFENPFWKYYKTFADHGRRLSYLLTGGEHVADVAVLYPIENLWAGCGPGSAQKAIEILVAAQIDCDVIDPDSLARLAGPAGAAVRPTYRALVLPGVRCLGRGSAGAIARWLERGGGLIVCDRWPEDSPEGGRGDPELARLRDAAAARGVSPIAPEAIAARIPEILERDVVVEGGLRESLRYHHVRRDGREVYFLANDATERRSGLVNVRARGAAEFWDPEDGSIRPAAARAAGGGRVACDVALDPGQGVFLVVDPRRELEDAGASRAAGVEVAARIPIPGPWRFIPAGEELDHAWRTDVSEVELALPVMRIRWEHDANGRLEGWTRADYDHSGWRRWKVADRFYPEAGAHRYRSKWDARAISLYDHSGFHTRIGGKGLRARKTVEVPEGLQAGWLAVLTEGAFRLRAGERAFEGRSEGKPVRFDLDGLRSGPLPIEVEAAEARYVLLEGRIGKEGGPRLAIATDATWEVSLGGPKWLPAWEYVAPPEKPCGEPEYPEPRPIPFVVWYREILPPGTSAVLEPKVEGRWRIWVDGQPQLFLNGEAELEPEDRPRPIVLRVRLEDDAQRALLEPIRFRCRPAVQPLRSWTEAGLDWYSGRALYATSFDLAPESLAPGTRLFVDLGRVAYSAEVWLNGKLAGTRVWPPYRVEVTAFAREGENRLEVVVANLLANRMRWDIFHDVVGVEWNRKWHDGNIRRDAWCLESGLLGPAEVVVERAR